MAATLVCGTCPGRRSTSTTVRIVPWFTVRDREGNGIRHH